MSEVARRTRRIEWVGRDDRGRRVGTVTVNGTRVAVRRGRNGTLYLRDATGRWRRPGELALLPAKS